MGQHQMIVCQGQSELFFQPGPLLAKAIGLACQSPVVLAERQVLLTTDGHEASSLVLCQYRSFKDR